VPDHIKAALVDDWENITKNNQLVPIPHPHPVTEVINDYLIFERPRREEGSALRDILEETMAGLKEYFERGLPRILLYRYGQRGCITVCRGEDEDANETKL
jgi:mortality factor 4-like protein 1